jgi:hypothetical protein
MLSVWGLQKMPSRSLALVLFVGLCVALTAAQSPPKSHASPTPRLIILPLKLIAGAKATLAVLDSQGRLLPNIAVELSGGQKVTTDVTGRALFEVSNLPGTMVAKISGRGISGSATVLASEDSAPHEATQGPPAGVNVISSPHFVTLHDRFTVEGAGFRGAADSNHVYLNGDPCLVLASSPVSLVALPGPRVAVGKVNLRVTVAGIDAGEFPVSTVRLEFSGPTDAVNAGSTGKIVVRARGTTEPLLLEVRNGSPRVIQLLKGNVQRLKTSGGDQNIAPIEVNFVKDGNYAVSARLVSTDRSQPRSGIAQKVSGGGAENRVR